MSQIRVAVAGAAGRMGQEVVRTVLAQSDMKLVAGLDTAQFEGQDIGTVVGAAATGVKMVSTMAALLHAKPQVLVDFTRFDIAPANLKMSLQNGVAAVVGTTGIAPAVMDELGQVALQHDTACFFAPNFSVGAVLMMMFAQQAAHYFDWAEVIELHHEKKLDAPSGTALRTADMMREGRGRTFSTPPSETLKLEGVRGGLRDGIRIHSVRMPGYLAHQEVMFGGDGEVLTIRHDSTHRTSFMPGVMLSIRRAPALRGLVVGLEKLMSQPS